MTRKSLCSALIVLAASYSVLASPKEEVTAAAKKLGEQPNYTWKQTVVVPEGAQFRPGPTEGKIEKDGYTVVSSSFGDNTTQTVLKGTKGAMTNRDGVWESLDEVEKEEGFGRFRAAMARNLKPPAIQAADLATGTKDLKKDGDTYSGDLTEETAKTLLTFRRGGGADASNAKGSVKFWVKDGALVKYEYKVKGTVSFNGNDRDVDRTTTVEITDVGSTKVTVPEQAKKKVS
ncbi:MAG: hypothetical protein U1G07_01235 [Verrucomicrobiota bacterium]